jgi:hypothetical protein
VGDSGARHSILGVTQDVLMGETTYFRVAAVSDERGDGLKGGACANPHTG